MMKLINKFLYVFVLLPILVGCKLKPDDLLTKNATTGGLAIINNPSLNYVVGSGSEYNLVINELKQESANLVKEVRFYKSFYSVSDTAWSGEILGGTVAPVAVGNFTSATLKQTFEDLRSGITLNGKDLPTSDSEFNIGDNWNFRIIIVLNDNSEIQSGAIKVTISTRYAGSYEIVESTYLHPINGNTGDFNDVIRVIESIDAITYKMTDIGPWESEDNFFYFTVNDGNITVPKEYNGSTQLLWGTDDIAICDAGETPGIETLYGGCGNKVTNDDEKGKDEIKISYGYIRDTGTRQFFERMIKIN